MSDLFDTGVAKTQFRFYDHDDDGDDDEGDDDDNDDYDEQCQIFQI